MPFTGSDKASLEEALNLKKIKHGSWKRQKKESLVVRIDKKADLVYLMQLIKTHNQGCSSQSLLRIGTAPNDWDYTEAKSDTVEPFLRRINLSADVIAQFVGPEFAMIQGPFGVNSDIISIGPNVVSGALVTQAEKAFKLLSPSSSKPNSLFLDAAAVNELRSGPLPPISALTVGFEILRADGVIGLLENKTDNNFNILKHCHLGLYGIILRQYVKCSPLFYKLECKEENWNQQRFLQEIDNDLFTRDPSSHLSVSYIPSADDQKAESKANFRIRTLTPVSITMADKGEPLKDQPLFTLGKEYKEPNISVGSWSTQVFDNILYPVGTDSLGLLLRCKSNSSMILDALTVIFKLTAQFKAKHEFPLAIHIQAQQQADESARASWATAFHENDEMVYRISFYSIRNNKFWKDFKEEIIERFTLFDFRPLFDLSLGIPQNINIFEQYDERYALAKSMHDKFYLDRGIDPLHNPFITEELHELLPDEEEEDLLELGYLQDNENLQVVISSGIPTQNEETDLTAQNKIIEAAQLQRFAQSAQALKTTSFLAERGLSPIMERSELKSSGTPLTSTAVTPVNMTPRSSPTENADDSDADEVSTLRIHTVDSDSDEEVIHNFHMGP